ncbi:MAG: cold shock domain-containing protein [Brumimicrobium sp.]|nr:cold shock domain-containing protein [Brumimicrobium sp.]MCO5267581.1 cold shock domain-containing protein [Brumimicrobium sp.]
MADSYNKKSLQQKRDKKKKDKQERREERKMNNDKGKGLDDMIAYLDEFGNITDTPPELQKRSEINVEDIQLGAAPITHDKPSEFVGTVVSFFADKSYGFIKEDGSDAIVFVHSNNLTEPISENNKVTYEKERTPKGYAAINVKKVK